MTKRKRKKETNEPFFDGKRYYNQNRFADQRKLKDIFFWFLTRKKTSSSHIPKEKNHTNTNLRQRVGLGELMITFVNHSTLLLQIDGINILTDPIWSKRCSPFQWIGPKRLIPPGIAWENLPPIDLVLVTHNHYDHMDVPTLIKLQKEHRPLFFVPKGNSVYLKKKGLFSVEEMNWWEEAILVQDLKLCFVPSQHFARRSFFDRNKTLWGGYVIQGKGKPIYFAGDTGYSSHFKEIRQEFGSFQLACLPIGAYLPRQLMLGIHMNPEEAVKAHLDLEASFSIPIHYGTFQLSDEDIHQPVLELKKMIKKAQLSENSFLILNPGEGKEIIK